jgi:hypothetical protein
VVLEQAAEPAVHQKSIRAFVRVRLEASGFWEEIRDLRNCDTTPLEPRTDWI